MYGYVKIAAETIETGVADPRGNAERIAAAVVAADKEGTAVVAFPELSLTGYTCGDLFLQAALLEQTDGAMKTLAARTADTGTLAFVGVPVKADGKLYNCAVAMRGGRILGAVPKTFLPDYGEFYEPRMFAPAPDAPVWTTIGGQRVVMSKRLLFAAENVENLVVAAEICEDLWTAVPPSSAACRAGATVVVNLSASNETIGKADWRRTLVKAQSGRCIAVYAYADAGSGESTTDLVFSGHNLIASNGAVVAECPPFGAGRVSAAVDLERLAFDRRRMNTFTADREGFTEVAFTAKDDPFAVDPPPRTPFVPRTDLERESRAAQILAMQSHALAKRLKITGARPVVGVSGGLDSTLALLVAVRACKILGRPASDIIAVTMPCFGTTGRTLSNARALMRAVGAEARTIRVDRAVRRHFKDIGHDESVLNAAYENAQARERTQVLMDIANDAGGIVVGTGDLSELALGWATYNGDHMSMYGVNASVPKTLVKYLVRAVADSDPTLKKVLTDILDTEISPELLPPDGGKIAQKTEDIIGKYEINDFFLYYTIRWGFAAQKILWLAGLAFPEYPPAALETLLDNFYKRFVSQQFKRSALPDGVKVGSVSLSPRGDWRMPSDSDYKP